MCMPVILLCGVTFVLGQFAVGCLWFRYSEVSSPSAPKAEEVTTQFRVVKGFSGEILKLGLIRGRSTASTACTKQRHISMA
jgi:hypothetical protein